MSYQFLNIIDILGTAAFAVSGALLAIEKKLDPFGVVVIAFVTAIGGGTLRDIMIGNLPVGWLRNETAPLVILFSAVAAMLFSSRIKTLTTTLFLFDALGLGLFTIAGLEIGLNKGFSPGICIALGTITASFGGVIRDVFLNTVPLLFRKEIYAMACISGGIIYFLLRQTALPADMVRVVSMLLIFVIRILAVRLQWSLPVFYKHNQSQ